MSQSKRIAIIGAGPMGLAVAYQLVVHGYKPVLFEADDRVGGMTATFDFKGTEIERYYHFHCTSDVDFFQLLDELSLGDKMHWIETKMGYWYKGIVQPWGNPFALLRFKHLSLIAKIRYGLHAFFCTKKKVWQDLDKIEAISWLKKWVGEEAYNTLWRKLFELKFYNYSNQLSAAWIWSRVRRIGQSRYNIFKEKLGYLEGGSQTFLTALEKSIKTKGGVLRLSTSVQEILIEEGKLKGLKTKDGSEEFDVIISTIPLPFVPSIAPQLPAELLTRYQKLKNVAVVCVVVKLKQQVTENFWLNTNDPDMDIPGIVSYTNLRSMGRLHIVYAPFYMPSSHVKYKDGNEVFADKVCRYLKTINPSLKDDDIIDVHVSRYNFAQPVCPPRFLESLPDVKTPIDNLWIADTSHYYPEDRGISESIKYGRKLAIKAVS